MKKMLYITNIPTPYRNFRFNLLYQEFAAQGIEVEVLYMNRSEADRHWQLEPENMTYPYRIFSQRQVKKRLGMWMHICPSLLAYLRKTDYDVAVLGGLASPAHFITALLLKKRALRILSVESNLASIGNKSGFASCLKNQLMKRFDAFQVTGKRAQAYVQHYLPKAVSQDFIYLPNVIDEGVYGQSGETALPDSVVTLLKQQVSANRKLMLVPARLIEQKGLLPFLTCLQPNDPLAVFIAGDGPLKAQLQDYVKANGLNVTLLGQMPAEYVAALMRQVDYLVLPSKSDPSPLSVIEACYSGLPMLLSQNVGNYPDVLEDGENGWSFEFNNAQSTRAAIDAAIAATPCKIEHMRQYGKGIFEQRFAAKKVIQRYVAGVCAKLESA